MCKVDNESLKTPYDSKNDLQISTDKRHSLVPPKAEGTPLNSSPKFINNLNESK